MELSFLKELFIKNLKGFYSSDVMYATYSTETQLNAGLNGGDATIKSFIDGKKSDIQGIEDQVNALSVSDVFDNFDDSLSYTENGTYLEGYLSNCDSDEKKLICIKSMQNVKNIEKSFL